MAVRALVSPNKIGGLWASCAVLRAGSSDRNAGGGVGQPTKHWHEGSISHTNQSNGTAMGFGSDDLTSQWLAAHGDLVRPPC